MATHPKHLLLLLLGVALAFLVPFEDPVAPKRTRKRGQAAASSAAAVGGIWGNQKFLDEHLTHALNILPVASGAQFAEKPTVRVSQPDDVVGILSADFAASFRRMGATSPAAVTALARGFAQRLPAVYDPQGNQIHILPANAVAAADTAGDQDLLSEGVLRLLLVRMCAIAQDRQLFPEWKEALDGAQSLDAMSTIGAVLQGHAQYLTERVATKARDRAWQLQPDFLRLVSLLTTPGPKGPQSANLDADIKFAILKGHAFISAVAKKKGRGGLQKAMREPPLERSAIFDPDKWLGVPKKKTAGKVPARVLAEFAALTAGDGKTLAPKELAQADADALLAGIEPQYTATIRRAFKSGTAWHVTREGQPGGTTITLIEMANAGMAEGLVNTAMGQQKKAAGANLEEGAGRDSGLVGFVTHAPVEGDEAGQARTTQWTYEGRYVLGLTTTDAAITREMQDDALEAAAEVIAKVQKTRDSRRKRRK